MLVVRRKGVKLFHKFYTNHITILQYESRCYQIYRSHINEIYQYKISDTFVSTEYYLQLHIDMWYFVFLSIAVGSGAETERPVRACLDRPVTGVRV